MTPEILTAVMPNCRDPAEWSEALNIAVAKYIGIVALERQAVFLAQIAHESGELTRLEENLRYSPQRLMDVWPKRFPTLAVASKYANSPHALADYVYANRMGNGDETSGDGWRYRGRGPIMATGKDMYRQLGKVLEVPLLDCPDILCTKKYGALSAAYIWMSKGLNALADDLPDDDDAADFVCITRRINGGTEGLESRKKYLKRARAALGLKEV